MDLSRAGLVICLTLVIVIGINAFIYVAATRRNTAGEIRMMRNAFKRIRNPWETEDNALAELSQLVAQFKDQKNDEEKETEPKDGK
jgi:hypothetical protein